VHKRIIAGITILIVFDSACGVGAVQYIDRGNKFFESGRYADAEINYRKAVQKDPKLGEAYYRLGTVLLREAHADEAYKSLVVAAGSLPGRHDVAVALADASFAAYLRNPRAALYYDQVSSASSAFLKEDPKSFDGLRLKGYVAMFDKHYSEAVRLLRAADEVRPMQQDVVLALVQCLIQVHQDAEAEKLGQSLIQKDKTFVPIYDVLYRLYINGNRLAEAEAVLKAKVANNADNAAYRLELASHYAGTGQEAELKQTIQRLQEGNRFPDSALQIGDFYAALNRMDDAVTEFQVGATRFPKNKVIYQKRIARILIFQGKKDQARKLVEQILKEHGSDYDARMMRASIDVDSGDRSKLTSGTAELQSLAQEKPTDAIVRVNLGKARILSGDLRGALAEFDEAQQIDPELSQARMLAADTSLRMENYQQALQDVDLILQVAPENPVARLIKIKSLAGLGRTGQAAAEANQLATDFPADAAPKLELASIQLGQKNFAKAESMFRALYEADRKNLDALQGLINSLSQEQRYDAAVDTLKQALGRIDSADIRGMLAEVYLRGRKLDLALQAYSALTSEYPNSPLFHLRLGDAFLQAGNASAAIAQFQATRKLAPKDAMTDSMLALSLEQAGRAQEASLAYRDALALDPDNPLLMNNLAYVIAETGGDLNAALQFALGASRRQPGNPAFSDTVGWIYIKKNMTHDALVVLADIVRKNPAQPVYHYHYASALFQQGDKPEARRQLEAALANRPGKADEAKINELLSATR